MLTSVNKLDTAPSALDRIMDAALIEFGEHGIDATRMDDIATRAGLSKQLIYYYYRTKQGLYAEVIDKVCVEMHKPFLEADFDALSPLDAIRKYFYIAVDVNLYASHHLASDQALLCGEYVKPSSVMYALGAKVMSIMERIIKRGWLDGSISRQIDVTMTFLQINLMATGFNMSKVMMSKYLRQDLLTDAKAQQWREHVVRSMMASVSTDQ